MCSNKSHLTLVYKPFQQQTYFKLPSRFFSFWSSGTVAAVPFRLSAASCVIICYFLWEGERIRYLLPPRISPGGHPAAISTSSALDVERQTRDWNWQFVVRRSRPVMNLFICILRLSLLPCIVLPVFCVYVWNSFQGSIWLKTKFPFCSEMFCLTTDA